MLEGFIMCGDVPVATFSGRIVTTINPDLAPLCFRNGGDLDTWLESRAIDRHRTNSRALKRLLRLGDTSDTNTALRVHGATITDNYWVKLSGESLCWKDVQFSTDYFADVALTGSADSLTRHYSEEQLTSPTPELTNVGSYEKCWRIIDGTWTMVKRGTKEELFSELFTAELGTRLGFSMAQYREIAGNIATPDFTDGRVNFEPMANLMADNEEYGDNYKILMNIAPYVVKQYLDILFMDALVFNPDRHTQNYGVLRNRKDGKILSMAPNFDNNMALISRGYIPDISQASNMLIPMFHELLEDAEITYDYPFLSEDVVKDIASSIMPHADIDRDYVVRFVMENYKKLKK